MTTEKIAPSIAEVPSVESEIAAKKQATTREVKGAKAATGTRKKGSIKASAKAGKPTKTAVAKPAAAKAKVESKVKHVEIVEKAKKDKLVRDSFTIPATEYALFSELKKRCLTNGVAVKKSEVLRAALASLSAASDANVLKAINRLNIIKTGRPAKSKA
jgi:hypothetical protein